MERLGTLWASHLGQTRLATGIEVVAVPKLAVAVEAMVLAKLAAVVEAMALAKLAVAVQVTVPARVDRRPPVDFVYLGVVFMPIDEDLDLLSKVYYPNPFRGPYSIGGF